MRFLFRMLCLIMICILSVSFAYADHTDLVWGMSEEEVKPLMRQYKYSYDANNSPYWANVKISKYKEDLKLGYDNGKLYSKVFEITDDDKRQTKFKNIGNALQKKYGKPIEDTSQWTKKDMADKNKARLMWCAFMGDHLDNVTYEFLETFEFFDGIENGQIYMKLWEPDENTYILLANMLNWDVYPSHTRVTYVSQEYVYDNDDLGGI